MLDAALARVLDAHRHGTPLLVRCDTAGGTKTGQVREGRRPGGDHRPAPRHGDHPITPAGTRVIVRRERPHPGAQLSVFEETDGWRYTTFATNTPAGPDGALAHLDARPAVSLGA